MKIPKVCLTQNALKKVFRTFLQTAIGYIITNITLYFGGIDFGDGSLLRNAAIGMALAAFSAGSAAVMNIEKVEQDDKKVNSYEKKEDESKDNSNEKISGGEEK